MKRPFALMAVVLSMLGSPTGSAREPELKACAAGLALDAATVGVFLSESFPMWTMFNQLGGSKRQWIRRLELPLGAAGMGNHLGMYFRTLVRIGDSQSAFGGLGNFVGGVAQDSVLGGVGSAAIDPFLMLGDYVWDGKLDRPWRLTKNAYILTRGMNSIRKEYSGSCIKPASVTGQNAQSTPLTTRATGSPEISNLALSPSSTRPPIVRRSGANASQFDRVFSAK